MKIEALSIALQARIPTLLWGCSRHRQDRNPERDSPLLWEPDGDGDRLRP